MAGAHQSACPPSATSDISDANARRLDRWLRQRAQQDTLRFLTCGSVDDGKSTLIGRLLWETGQIPDDQLAALQADSRRHGTQGHDIDFALLADGLAAEREQGITIDVAYRFFATPRRKFIVADTPGHEQFTRNMVTGASTADAAVLLIDARRGIQTQTRHHAYLVSLLGIRHIAVAVNKMDLVGYEQRVFDDIVESFAGATAECSFSSVTPFPLSAIRGDNLTSPSPRTAWYRGPTFLEFLETVDTTQPPDGKLIFPVQWVNRPNPDFRGWSGTVAAGRVALGDRIRVTASGETARVARLVTMSGDLPAAEAGDAVTIVADREVDASRGDVLAHAEQPLETTDQFEATLVWMSEEAGMPGRVYECKLAHQWAAASISAISYRIDVNTRRHELCRALALNDIAVCKFALSRNVVFEQYERSRTLGGFILVDKFSHATVAAGMIRHSLRRAQNVHRQSLSIRREDRERLNGHRGKVIWFTGLSGSGKSTIANALEEVLHSQGKRTYILDGDNIRQGLNKDLGFADVDRVENIRRVAEVAKLMMDAGMIVMTAFISPFRAEREMARQLIGAEHFLEVFVATPLAICEQRDPKGLYKKARAGALPNMTGVSSSYEPPDAPSVVVDTAQISAEEAAAMLIQAL